MILSRCYYKSSNSSTNFQWVIESKLCQVIKLIRKFSFLKRIDHFVIINFFLQRAKYDFCLFDRHCSLSDILQSLIFYLSIFLFVSFNTFISACISYLLLLQIIQLTFCVCVLSPPKQVYQCVNLSCSKTVCISSCSFSFATFSCYIKCAIFKFHYSTSDKDIRQILCSLEAGPSFGEIEMVLKNISIQLCFLWHHHLANFLICCLYEVLKTNFKI